MLESSFLDLAKLLERTIQVCNTCFYVHIFIIVLLKDTTTDQDCLISSISGLLYLVETSDLVWW